MFWISFTAITGFLVAQGHARMGELAYPLVERSLQTQEISVQELEDFMLTFSFNSPPKTLEQFWLDLYDTDGWLPDNSTGTIEQALEAFLVPEVNARYSHHTVKELDAQVVSQATITSSRRRERRNLQGMIGSELQTELTVTFRNEPSPDKLEVEEIIKDIMQNLTMFLSNLTVLGQGDIELANINRAERKENGGFGQVDDDFIPPTTAAGERDPEPKEDDDGLGLALFMTVIAGGFVVLASIALFSVRSRTRSKEVEELAPSGLGQVNVFLGDEDEDDIFSFEAALIESPDKSDASRMSASVMSASMMSESVTPTSAAQSDTSSFYSGMDSQLTSPQESKSVFSFLSGMKSEGSTSTVMASNKRKDVSQPRQSGKLPSLMTFSGEDSEESEDDAPLVAGTVLQPRQKSGPSPSAASTNDQQETTKIIGVTRVKFAPHATQFGQGESGSSAHSDTSESLDQLSPSSSTSPPAESYNPRWADTTFPVSSGTRNVAGSNPKTEPTENTSQKSQSASGANSTDHHEVNVAWNNAEEASENAAKAAAFVRAASPARDRGKSASPGPRPRVFRSPNTNKPENTADRSPAFSPGGRKKGQNGRRHAKSTSADGSRNYQYATMHQKDEGLASFDAVSLSDSEPSVTDQNPKTPQSQGTSPSDEGNSFFSLSTTSSDGDGSNKKLLNDLVWLEKKIAGGANKNNGNNEAPSAEAETPRNRQIEQIDSLSFASNDAGDEASMDSPDAKAGQRDREVPKGVSAIVCRDCFAPPGKLRIVIHSTKDGPAIHTVKTGSSLTGHVFPGDLIISVDDVDTRSFSAEQVMKMMTARNKYQRKITVLHFESENN